MPNKSFVWLGRLGAIWNICTSTSTHSNSHGGESRDGAGVLAAVRLPGPDCQDLILMGLPHFYKLAQLQVYALSTIGCPMPRAPHTPPPLPSSRSQTNDAICAQDSLTFSDSISQSARNFGNVPDCEFVAGAQLISENTA